MITLVAGAPCSGKSTYVSQHAQPHHLVVDFDEIAQDYGSPRTHNHARQYAEPAGQVCDELLQQIADGLHPDAWVIRSAPSTAVINQTAAHIKADHVIWLTHPRDVLVARAQERPNPAHAVRLIDWWLGATDT